MKGLPRLILLLTILIVLPLFCLVRRVLLDICDQYSAGSYLAAYLNANRHEPYNNRYRLPTTPTGDKVVVMGRLQEDDTSWVVNELPDWQRAIYTVNPTTHGSNYENTLTTPLNKGHESMAYLTYIIDHYHKLPSTIVFLHAHRSGFLMAWHVDTPLHDNVEALRSLRLDFVQLNGYVNLRCNWNPGCMEAHRENRHVTEEVWRDVFNGTSTPPYSVVSAGSGGLGDSSVFSVGSGVSASASAFSRVPVPAPVSGPASVPAASGAVVNSQPVPVGGGLTGRGVIGSEERYRQRQQKPIQIPRRVGAACCAQFAVSRAQVLQRPREDYVRFRDWVTRTDKDSAASGRVMEFLWHFIFGKEAVYCPDEQLCYCQVYGRC